MEQYYHAPGKFSTMVLEVGARALTKHALNVHCGHDDFYAALDTGWTMLVGKDAQQAADQAIILRKVNELALNPGMNIQDGMLTTHSERTYLAPEAELLREYLGAPDDMIDCPTPAQRELFGPKRRRVPEMMDLKNPILLGPVQNQEHHMNGVVARRNNFNEPILKFLEAGLRGVRPADRPLLRPDHANTRREDADTVFVSLGCAAENIEAACDYLREQRNAKVGSIHVNVIRPFPEAAIINALRGKKNVIILERTDEGLAGDNPLGRDIRAALGKAHRSARNSAATLPAFTPEEMPRIFRGSYGIGSRDFRPEHIARRLRIRHRPDPAQRRQERGRRRDLFRARRRSSLRGDFQRHALAAAGQSHRRPVPFHRRLGHDHDRQKSRRDHRRLRQI